MNDLIRYATPDERRALAALALGRLLRIGSRPYQPGDDEQYNEVRSIIMECSDEPAYDHRPNYARDRNNGAQGD